MRSELSIVADRLYALEQEDSRLEARLQELYREIEELKEKKAEYAKERVELEITAKTISRLRGLPEEPSILDENVKIATEDLLALPVENLSVLAGHDHSSQEANTPVPELILRVVKEVGHPIEPVKIAGIIRKNWREEIETNHVGKTCWRMWKDGRLEKEDGSSLYRLPQTNEAPDANAGQRQSEASESSTPAQGREAGPGGST